MSETCHKREDGRHRKVARGDPTHASRVFSRYRIGPPAAERRIRTKESPALVREVRGCGSRDCGEMFNIYGMTSFVFAGLHGADCARRELLAGETQVASQSRKGQGPRRALRNAPTDTRHQLRRHCKDSSVGIVANHCMQGVVCVLSSPSGYTTARLGTATHDWALRWSPRPNRPMSCRRTSYWRRLAVEFWRVWGQAAYHEP